jgi:hypothetical protein
VGVVDDAERIPHRADPLEPSGHAREVAERRDHLGLAPGAGRGREHETGGQQRVLDLERPDEG